jgi:hypothetical protein
MIPTKNILMLLAGVVSSFIGFKVQHSYLEDLEVRAKSKSSLPSHNFRFKKCVGEMKNLKK